MTMTTGDDRGEIKRCIRAKKTVELLLSEGATKACDSTQVGFDETDLPPFYDEDKFKKGQQFYHRHIFGMFFGKLLGLITVLSVPSILKILMFTKMSSEPYTAYKRYLATIFHMCVWYDDDFKPGSNLWKSVKVVKTLHNSASRRSCTAGLNGISQKDMALTQFGFMGYFVVNPEYLGMYDVPDEDLEPFVHLWRVVGHLMGIEDRFNICRESVQETREICQELIESTFIPNVKNQDPNFLHMADCLVSGMWVMHPILDTKVFLHHVYALLGRQVGNNNNNNNNAATLPEVELKGRQRVNLLLMNSGLTLVRYSFFKWFFNMLQYLTFWLMRNFPFLAYYKYGYSRSHISNILVTDN